ncbi:MAG: YncE family protein [Candidatus Korobacteraceae bacterium]
MTHGEALRRRIITSVIILLAASLSAAAQTLITTVTAGDDPAAIAVDPTTNKIYVVNQDSFNGYSYYMTVIDGVTYTTATVPMGAAPDAVAVNAATNKIYVANGNSNSVTVVNGATNGTTSVAVGDYPFAIAANAVTNKIYVANYYSNNVTVIDGATNLTTTVGVGSHPFAVAVNPATNTIYVADNGSNDVAIIDGATNLVTTVGVGPYPRAIAIDPVTNQIYVANYGSNSTCNSNSYASYVSVIDGATNSVTSSVAVGICPGAVVVNPVSSQVYVANYGSGTATIIDETTLATTTVSAGSSPIAVDVDPMTNHAYLSNFLWDGTVTVVDGNNASATSVSLGENGIYPNAIAVNPLTNTVYVADNVGNSVSVIAGASSDAVQFVLVTPCRVADTRQPDGPFGGPYLSGGTSRSFAVPQSDCNIPNTAIAYSLNVTVVPLQGELRYLTLWPTAIPQPLISTLNSYDGRVKANAAIVPAGAEGAVSVYVTDSTHVILDINGYFLWPAGSTLQFYPLPPCRVADTRNSNYPQGLGPPSLSAGEPRDFPVLNATTCFQQVPPGVTPAAYSFNFTAVPQGPLGYLTVWAEGWSQPLVSTLNAPTGTVVANAAIVPAGRDGGISAFAYNNTNLLIDINGYFAAPGTGGLSLYPMAPCRVLDTRNGNGAFSGVLNPPVDVLGSPCGVPSQSQAYVFNATVVPEGPLGYLTLWPDGGQQPDVSTLNAVDGAVTSNMAVLSSGNQGKVDAYAHGLTQLILDISSYFAP